MAIHISDLTVAISDEQHLLIGARTAEAVVELESVFPEGRWVCEPVSGRSWYRLPIKVSPRVAELTQHIREGDQVLVIESGSYFGKRGVARRVIGRLVAVEFDDKVAMVEFDDKVLRLL